MHAFQAPGVPPMMGRTILPIIGWIEKSSRADKNVVDSNNQTNAGILERNDFRNGVNEVGARLGFPLVDLDRSSTIILNSQDA
jgi:hypothetical protein